MYYSHLPPLLPQSYIFFNILKAESCSPQDWNGYDGKVCGSCSALVKIRKYGSCEAFCTAQGLSCKDSWDDEENEECSPSAEKRGCGHIWRRTSDAICECIAGKDLIYSTLIEYDIHYLIKCFLSKVDFIDTIFLLDVLETSALERSQCVGTPIFHCNIASLKF